MISKILSTLQYGWHTATAMYLLELDYVADGTRVGEALGYIFYDNGKIDLVQDPAKATAFDFPLAVAVQLIASKKLALAKPAESGLHLSMVTTNDAAFIAAITSGPAPQPTAGS